MRLVLQSGGGWSGNSEQQFGVEPGRLRPPFFRPCVPLLRSRRLGQLRGSQMGTALLISGLALAVALTALGHLHRLRGLQVV